MLLPVEKRLENKGVRLGSAFLALCILATCPAYAAAEHKALAGHYYLRGMMEVGSELLLKEDGSYEWFISYGSVDQASKGSWQVDGQEITLKAVGVTDGRVPVTPQESGDWSDYAEYRLRSEMAELESAKRALRCPSMTLASTTNVAYTANAKPDPRLAPKARDALKSLAGLRLAAEQAAEQFADMPSDTGLRAKSDAAVKAFWDQTVVASDLAHASGIGIPNIDGPKTPSKCRPSAAINRNTPAAEWIGRQAVVVIDPKMDMGIPDVGIRVDFANGQSAEGRTDGRGAFFPMPQVYDDVRQVTVSYAKAGLAPAVIPISRKGRVLVILDFDYRAVSPAFSTMTLLRVADGLKPEGGLRGVYTREGAK